LKSYLTQTKKKNYLSLLIKRQNGFRCYQCNKILDGGNYIFEHLNDNRFDNRVENIALACQSCNVKKITHGDFTIIARNLLKKNEESALLEEDSGLESKSSEIEINRTLRPFCKQYLFERVNVDGNIVLTDAILELTYLGQERFGCGAESTIRKYIAELTCKVAPFMIIKEGKERLIVRRTGN